MFKKFGIKYAGLILFITICCALLTACDIHFGNVHYDISWWGIAVPVIIVCVIAHIILIQQTYQCPKCGAKFKPKWYELSVSIHIGNDRIVKCPNCKKRGFCQKVP